MTTLAAIMLGVVIGAALATAYWARWVWKAMQ